MDTPTLLAWLKKGGYSLGVETRVEARHHDAGVHHVTYTDKLLIEGPEEPPKEIWEDMREHRDELLAAASVLHPPVGWLEELVERHRTGYQHIWKSRHDGNGNPLITGISLECLAANVASFIGLHPHKGTKLEGIIRAALAEEEEDECILKEVADASADSRSVVSFERLHHLQGEGDRGEGKS